MRALLRLICILALCAATTAQADVQATSPKFLAKWDTRTGVPHYMRWNPPIMGRPAVIRYHFVTKEIELADWWSPHNCRKAKPFSELTRSGLSEEMLKAETLKAMARWAAVADITFTEAASVEDATFLFSSYEPIDSTSATVGFANLQLSRDTPQGGLTYEIRRAVACLRVSHPWHLRPDATPAAVNFAAAMTHEIGHGLGFDHSTNIDAVMYHANLANPELREADISGARRLYGVRMAPTQ